MGLKRDAAFSLAELLIGLAILGIISAFAIPSVYTGSSNSSNARYTTITRDTAFMVISAYERYRVANASVSSSTTLGAITPYMSYVAVDSSSTVDLGVGSTSITCSSLTCLKLHNGAILYFGNTVSFGGTNSTNAISFLVDQDGVYSGGTNKSVTLYLQYDGSLHNRGNLPRPVTTSVTTFTADTTLDPPWFQGF